MGMRVDCKNYESRTYPSGEVVRMCRLDLAPEAPWKCPDDCPKYERRMGDAGWTLGKLAPAKERLPTPSDLPGDAAALLDQAEDIINEIGPEILSEVKAQKQGRGRAARIRDRFRRRK